MTELSGFAQLSELVSDHALPPVEQWTPSLLGDIDIRIAADGAWYHEGTRIQRLELVRLFATLLWREDDRYFLVTPLEKLRIQVDDAPLLVTDIDFIDAGIASEVRCRTSTGDSFVLDADHPLRVATSLQGEPRPYVCVRRNLEALIHRNAFYRLIERAEERSAPTGTHWVLVSAHGQHLLGSLAEDA